MATELLHIPLNKIRQVSAGLREVNKTSEDYLGLVESVRQDGVLNPINVRRYNDAETGEELFSIIDGLHRFTASKDCNKETIPAQVLSMSDAEVLVAQLIANVQKVETRPVEYSQQLSRILAGDPMLTIGKLALRLGKSQSWLSERLGLVDLVKEVAEKVDAGIINLSNGYVLAKLPPEEQVLHIDTAMSMTPQEFGPKILARKKELDKARRQGRDATAQDFQPAPYLQKIGDIKAEMANPKVGPELVKALKLDKADSKTEAANKAFATGIAWCLHMDELSIAQQRNEHEARVAAQKKKREDAAAERKKKQSEKADLVAARLKVEVTTREAGGDVNAALKAFDDAHGLVDGKPAPAPAPAA